MSAPSVARSTKPTRDPKPEEFLYGYRFVTVKRRDGNETWKQVPLTLEVAPPARQAQRLRIRLCSQRSSHVYFD